MKRLLRGVAVLVALLLAALVGLGVAARFSDGPIFIFAGGPFESGTLVERAPTDWTFVKDVEEVQFQLLEPARSRITWIAVHDGKAYIPSGYMTTWWGQLWKRWPAEAERDGRILLRIGDSLYERRLVRVEQGPAVQPVMEELARKYMGGMEVPEDAVSSGGVWLFELAPRE